MSISNLFLLMKVPLIGELPTDNMDILSLVSKYIKSVFIFEEKGELYFHMNFYS